MAHKRKYSVYYKVDGKHRRLSASAYIKDVAVRVFQNTLLDGIQYQASLRPVREGEEVYHIVRGAYGRNYSTPEAAISAWTAGTDFSICDGPYCSRRDDVHVLIRLNDGVLVVAHGTPKEVACPGTATTSTS